MKEKSTVKKVLLSLYHYFCFFLLMAFLITCCMLLFLNTMSNSMGIEFTRENIKIAAGLTFGNVLLLSAICTLIDALRRKFTIDRPVKEIVAAAEKIAKGDYSVRIPRIHSINRADGLEEIVDCYNKMAEELCGIEMMQSDFIANVSHELKTPLAVMQNYATLLQSEDLNEEERLRYAKSISVSCRSLAELISNILKLNNLENQQIYPTVAPYHLTEQICECLLSYEKIWEEKEIEIDTDLQEDVHIFSDVELLSLVWNNLFSNALKFTPNGGRVHICLRTEAQHVIVSVTDSGCGISPEVGRHIFEKFYQGDPSHATKGNGLGLALVKRVIDIVGAEISVQSEVGVGSTFTVRIPNAIEAKNEIYF